MLRELVDELVDPLICVLTPCLHYTPTGCRPTIYEGCRTASSFFLETTVYPLHSLPDWFLLLAPLLHFHIDSFMFSFIGLTSTWQPLWPFSFNHSWPYYQGSLTFFPILFLSPAWLLCGFSSDWQPLPRGAILRSCIFLIDLKCSLLLHLIVSSAASFFLKQNVIWEVVISLSVSTFSSAGFSARVHGSQWESLHWLARTLGQASGALGDCVEMNKQKNLRSFSKKKEIRKKSQGSFLFI